MQYSTYNSRDDKLQKAAGQFLVALRVGCGLLLLLILLVG